MKIKEIAQTIKREVTDSFKGIDSNPEHIASFSAHLEGCSRTKPLKFSEELGRPLPSFNGANFAMGKTVISCSECGGSIVQK